MITVAGRRILRMLLHQSLCEPWTLQAELEGPDAVSGSVRCDVDGLALRGYTDDARTHATRGNCELFVFGGNGGLRKTFAPRVYQDAGGIKVTARTVARDICSSAGEDLDEAGSDAELLSTQHHVWVTQAGRTDLSLTALVREIGGQWRMTPAGTIQIVAPTWGPEAATADRLDRVIKRERDSVVLRAEESLDVDVMPGMTWQGRRIQAVDHHVQGQHASTVLWLALPGQLPVAEFLGQSQHDHAWTAAQLAPTAAYAGLRLGRVVTAHAGGMEVDVQPLVRVPTATGESLEADDAWPTLIKVPVETWGPRIRATVPVGTLCLWTCVAGSPRQPVVRAFIHGDRPASRVDVEAEELYLGSPSANDFVALAKKVDDALTSIRDHVNHHTHTVTGTADLGTGDVTGTAAAAVTIPNPGTVAATKVRAV